MVTTRKGQTTAPPPRPKPPPKAKTKAPNLKAKAKTTPKAQPVSKPSSKKTIVASKSTTPKLDSRTDSHDNVLPVVTMSAEELQSMKDELSSFRKLQAAQMAREQSEERMKGRFRLFHTSSG
jgi:hypothetical protein